MRCFGWVVFAVGMTSVSVGGVGLWAVLQEAGGGAAGVRSREVSEAIVVIWGVLVFPGLVLAALGGLLTKQ